LKRIVINPINLVVIAMVVLSALRQALVGNFSQWVVDTVLMLPGIIIGLSFHEFAHAMVATLCGDDTPRLQGRVTVNPIAHVDPVGIVMLLFVGFGWGRPVEINPNNFKKPRRDHLLVSLAGVTVNLILAFVFTGLWVLLVQTATDFMFSDFGTLINTMMSGIVSINLVLMVFNLLPIPPLDGFSVILDLFELRASKFHQFMYRYGYLILVFMIVFDITDVILGPAVNWLYMTILNIFM